MQAVKQTREIQQASDQSGSNIIPFREIEIPDVIADGMIDGLTKVLEIRKYLMDRQLEIQKLNGVAMRHQASIVKLQARLSQEKLGYADRLDIQGRIKEAQARLLGCRAKQEQYELEMRVQAHRLKG